MSEQTPFINRELSWLEFNRRVLMEAVDKDVPLLERLKFLAIFSSNLDEFFMIRVGGLKDQKLAGYTKVDISGMTPKQQLENISERAHELTTLRQEIFTQVKKDLDAEGIAIAPEVEPELDDITDAIFNEEIYPIISPVTLSPTNPMPFIYNFRLSVYVVLKKGKDLFHSIIILPDNLQRIFRVRLDKTYFIFAEDVLKKYLYLVFPDFEIIDSYCLRVTRNADLTLEEEGAEDLLGSIKKYLKTRRKGGICRLEVDGRLPADILEELASLMGFEKDDVYVIDDVIDMTSLFAVVGEKQELCYKPFTPAMPEGYSESADIFEYIKQNDVIMHRPYQDFSFVSKLVEKACNDSSVVAIKMTIYRANKNSTIMENLMKAARSGKHVSVVIELKARFDEERNVDWASMLEEAGCIVTYGIVGLKVHSKNLLIVRKEAGRIVRYSHISTGNFNEITANIYTDIDYITADEEVGKDSAALFNFLMGYTDIASWQHFYLSPKSIKGKLLELIDEEIKHAEKDEKAHIIIKVNSVMEKILLEKAIKASQAGVKIDFIVRGTCGLQPGIKGLTENITVRSIVGRFLEHSRIMYFHAGGRQRIFLTTADWMERNMDRRVELLFEVHKQHAKDFLWNILEENMKDNQKTWILNGVDYKKFKSGVNKFSHQKHQIDQI
ncbi:MAG: polyphosphate kinase 1 [Denitrovibrio sp.]|nr:MAG: polyphosphate kinase 1 [Denitrovibrio sp.]